MERPEKFTIKYTWFFDTYSLDYNLKDVVARLPADTSLEDVQVRHFENESRVAFYIARLIENKTYETEMKRYEEWRAKRIAEFEVELANLKEDV